MSLPVSASMSLVDPLFSETFGDAKKPAILLNAGAGCLGLTWPDAFCETLAQKEYFVMRYDYRDTGRSQHLPYDTRPYSALDLALDSVDILRRNGVTQAAYVGFSMGGQVSQVAAAYLPEHVTHAVLMGTSWDFEPGFLALEGKPPKEGLSAPHPDYVAWVTTPFDSSRQTPEERLAWYTKTWWHLDGRQSDFDEAFFEAQGKKIFETAGTDDPYPTHARAMKASYNQHMRAPSRINCPTLILQGTLDPVFPPDHGTALHKQIKGSELEVWEDFAHALSPKHFERLASAIDTFIKNNPK